MVEARSRFLELLPEHLIEGGLTPISVEFGPGSTLVLRKNVLTTVGKFIDILVFTGSRSNRVYDRLEST